MKCKRKKKYHILIISLRKDLFFSDIVLVLDTSDTSISTRQGVKTNWHIKPTDLCLYIICNYGGEIMLTKKCF